MIKNIAIADEIVINKIHISRKQKVMLDKDLTELYDVYYWEFKQSSKT